MFIPEPHHHEGPLSLVPVAVCLPLVYQEAVFFVVNLDPYFVAPRPHPQPKANPV